MNFTAMLTRPCCLTFNLMCLMVSSFNNKLCLIAFMLSLLFTVFVLTNLQLFHYSIIVVGKCFAAAFISQLSAVSAV